MKFCRFLKFLFYDVYFKSYSWNVKSKVNSSFSLPNICGKMPRACQFFNLTCQHAKKHAEFSTWHAIVPKVMPIFQIVMAKSQFFNITCQQVSHFFNSFPKKIFLNFSIILNICKFQEYLDNSRTFIFQNKVSKF